MAAILPDRETFRYIITLSYDKTNKTNGYIDTRITISSVTRFPIHFDRDCHLKINNAIPIIKLGGYRLGSAGENTLRFRSMGRKKVIESNQRAVSRRNYLSRTNLAS